MGINYHGRKKIDNDTIMNISKSGISISKKIGNITVNSRGGVTINLGNGIIIRQNLNQKQNQKKK